ncbi:hypothetical protein Tcan_00183, partial [Toxocara canis]
SALFYCAETVRFCFRHCLSRISRAACHLENTAYHLGNTFQSRHTAPPSEAPSASWCNFCESVVLDRNRMMIPPEQAVVRGQRLAKTKSPLDSGFSQEEVVCNFSSHLRNHAASSSISPTCSSSEKSDERYVGVHSSLSAVGSDNVDSVFSASSDSPPRF